MTIFLSARLKLLYKYVSKLEQNEVNLNKYFIQCISTALQYLWHPLPSFLKCKAVAPVKCAVFRLKSVMRDGEIESG
jgi:hypothetical protein